MKINEIYLGDCLELMPKHIEDKSIDMIFCDLPYGTTQCKWDSVIDLDKLWTEYKRVIKDNGAIVLFASQPFTTTLISSNFKMFRYELIWDKIRSATGLNAKRMPLKTHENICVFYKKQPIYNSQMTEGKKYDKTKYNGRKSDANVTGGGIENRVKNEGTRYPISIHKYSQNWRRQDQLHSTQKPLSLIEYMIKTYTNEGDLILDNTCGSGTTGLGAKNLNRDYIMMEQDPKYYEIACKRVQG